MFLKKYHMSMQLFDGEVINDEVRLTLPNSLGTIDLIPGWVHEVKPDESSIEELKKNFQNPWKDQPGFKGRCKKEDADALAKAIFKAVIDTHLQRSQKR